MLCRIRDTVKGITRIVAVEHALTDFPHVRWVTPRSVVCDGS